MIYSNPSNEAQGDGGPAPPANMIDGRNKHSPDGPRWDGKRGATPPRRRRRRRLLHKDPKAHDSLLKGSRWRLDARTPTLNT